VVPPPPDAARPRVEDIAEVLRRRIVTLVHPPGEVLKEADLADAFEVSRTPVRQALQQLQFEGLVESRHGVGTLVTEVDLEGLAEVYALRVRLAELVGDLDPVPPSPAHLEALRALQSRCAKLSPRGDPRRFAELNLDWHHAFTELVGNRPLRATIRQLFHRTARIWMSWGRDIDWPREIACFHREMGEILVCLEAGDVGAAGFAHRNHIALSLVRIRGYADRRTERTAS
jgi:DNA-binding GntR family transcriptional regulator